LMVDIQGWEMAFPLLQASRQSKREIDPKRPQTEGDWPA
jgi:hypothetical protein